MTRTSKPHDFKVSLASLERLKQLLQEVDMMFTKNTRGYKPSEDMITVMLDNSLRELTPETAANLHDAIIQVIKNNPVIKLTTAQPLSSDQQQVIVEWLRSRINPNIIASFKTQTQLIAGVAIQTPLNRLDYSLQSGLPKGRELLLKKVAV